MRDFLKKYGGPQKLRGSLAFPEIRGTLQKYGGFLELYVSAYILPGYAKAYRKRRLDFFKKVMARVRITGDGCWEWTGPDSGKAGAKKTGREYSRMHWAGQTVAVHIAMWSNFFGYVPRGKQLDHTCRNRKCVNHHHMDLVTHKKNCARRDAANRKLKP